MKQNRVQITRTVNEMRDVVRNWRRQGLSVALVPTMGALHEGHLSLARAGLRRCDRLITSIYVNPAQFAPGEDFDSYPRTFEDDLAKLEHIGGHLVWPQPAKKCIHRISPRKSPPAARQMDWRLIFARIFSKALQRFAANYSCSHKPILPFLARKITNNCA